MNTKHAGSQTSTLSFLLAAHGTQAVRSLSVVCSLLLTFCSLTSRAEEIVWRVAKGHSLPTGVQLFRGTRELPKLRAYYFKIDLTNEHLALRPYLFAEPKVVAESARDVEAVVAINGGFFGGSTSYSAVISDGEILARNIGAVTRAGISLPVMRSLFYVTQDNAPHIDWIAHYDGTLAGTYAFDQCLTYQANDTQPQKILSKTLGTPLQNVSQAMGGGPRLLRKGQPSITYNEEVFWGSGVGYENRDPRSAIGYTADQHLILFVADGRQPELSVGLSLPGLAKVMKSIGCVEAMALDGGGSTQLATLHGAVNNPSEQRKVPSILAVLIE